MAQGGYEMNESQQVTVWFKIDDIRDVKQNILRGTCAAFF